MPGTVLFTGWRLNIMHVHYHCVNHLICTLSISDKIVNLIGRSAIKRSLFDRLLTFKLPFIRQLYIIRSISHITFSHNSNCIASRALNDRSNNNCLRSFVFVFNGLRQIWKSISILVVQLINGKILKFLIVLRDCPHEITYRWQNKKYHGTVTIKCFFKFKFHLRKN